LYGLGGFVKDVTIYQMCINNVARKIRSTPPAIYDGDAEPTLNAFTCSEVLAIAFCKSPAEVILDIALAQKI
jgi:hypothetical protein